MGAIKLNINDFKPYLSDKSIELISDAIINDIEDIDTDYYFNLIECGNGFKVDYQIQVKGMRTKIFSISYLEIFNTDNSIDCEDFTDKLYALLSDRLRVINDESDKYCQSESQYRHDLMFSL